MAGNASTAFPAGLLSASASLSSHFFKAPLSFGGGPPIPPPPPKWPITESTIVAITAKKAESVEIIVIIYSRSKIQILSGKDVLLSKILSGKDVLLSKTFSRVSLFLTTWVWRSFRFCDSISSLACFSVFKPSNLSLYNCLCSSE